MVPIGGQPRGIGAVGDRPRDHDGVGVGGGGDHARAGDRLRPRIGEGADDLVHPRIPIAHRPLLRRFSPRDRATGIELVEAGIRSGARDRRGRRGGAGILGRSREAGVPVSGLAAGGGEHGAEDDGAGQAGARERAPWGMGSDGRHGMVLLGRWVGGRPEQWYRERAARLPAIRSPVMDSGQQRLEVCRCTPSPHHDRRSPMPSMSHCPTRSCSLAGPLLSGAHPGDAA